MSGGQRTIGRLSAVEDIAHIVLWLRSSGALNQTGLLMIVDGGLTLS
ncbi:MULTISPECIES: hypothetical protein [unclassified Rathayibacter]|nr:MULTISPECIES: hypothetical protein [unclassified Rathayibacter]